MLTILALITVVGMAHQLTHLLDYVASGQAWQDTEDEVGEGSQQAAYYRHMLVEFARVLCPMALAISVLVQ